VRKDSQFAKLGLDAADYTTAEPVIELLLQRPRLMQRPVIERGNRAIIGRPKDRVTSFLS
jgi:arsenate reductase